MRERRSQEHITAWRSIVCNNIEGMSIVRIGTAPLYNIARSVVLHMAYNICIDVAPEPKRSDGQIAVLICREYHLTCSCILNV